LPDAPKVAATPPETKALALELKTPRPIRSFTPPRQPAKPEGPNAIATPSPPLTAAAAMPSEDSLVIAGLNPAKSVEVPSPPGSVRAGFSGGLKPEPNGGEGTPTGAMLEIPSLTIQGGDKNPQQPVMVARVSPTSPEALAAALRDAHAPVPAPGSATRQAVRVASVPDPRMYGRQVYSMAIQVPNLTSYSGSWLVWFAGRERDMGNPSVEMHPPLPLHMVSPKYVNSAMEDRVEGKVRLWAVIGKDGRVGDISLLEHLDDRLDRSAEEALGKWLFQPAVRNGVVVDVDAVFEIPFNLAPKPPR
jgi:TonB family protein